MLLRFMEVGDLHRLTVKSRAMRRRALPACFDVQAFEMDPIALDWAKHVLVCDD